MQGWGLWCNFHVGITRPLSKVCSLPDALLVSVILNAVPSLMYNYCQLISFKMVILSCVGENAEEGSEKETAKAEANED